MRYCYLAVLLAASNNAVIHSSQLNYLIGLSNRPLEEWETKVVLLDSTVRKLLCLNRPKYLTSTSYLIPD